MNKINMVDFASNLFGMTPSKEIIKDEPKQLISEQKLTDEQYNAYMQHCSDKYFFCPLCEDFHRKIKDRESGKLRGHSLCQMPISEEV
jgi:translation initiation factor 2 beta subunit (eIF-2beta)/eIF-5